MGAEVQLESWPVPPIFRYLQKIGNVDRDEMYRAFNMGIGMVLVIPQSRLTAATTLLRRLRERYYLIGRILKGQHEVVYR
jgi:phosphoribosylformylglycinamidine cyclo-ligase